jgi:dolichol-phosphate mannosyltransferase
VKKISIICPVYNEQDIILKFYEKLKEELKKIKNYQFLITFILDKSEDRSESILKNIKKGDKNVRLIIMKSRYGHQACLLAGLDNSLNHDALIMMDSDLQHHPKYISAFLQKFNEGFDIVNAERKNLKNNLKSILSQIFYKFIKILLSNDFDQNSPDFRLISKKVINDITKDFRSKKIFFRIIVSKINVKKTKILYEENLREYSITKFNLNRSFKFAEDAIISASYKPLTIIFYLGLILSLFSFFFILFVLYNYFNNIYNVPRGWSTIIFLICFFNSIIFLSLGIAGRYIAAIHEEIKQTPIYSIEKIIS